MGTGVILAATSYTTAITNLKSVLLTLGSAIGAAMLVYGGIKFAMTLISFLKVSMQLNELAIETLSGS